MVPCSAIRASPCIPPPWVHTLKYYQYYYQGTYTYIKILPVHVFQKILGFKVSKSNNMNEKLFLRKILIWVPNQSRILCWFWNCLENAKICWQVQKLEFVLFCTTSLQKFVANNFFWMHFFQFHGFEISVKFCVFWIGTHAIKENFFLRKLSRHMSIIWN